jgi:ADP-ribose pyrophosphatase YjhB (NUDIX family)
MNDQHNYEKLNVVKIIVEDPNGKILLIQEPEMNEWMPGRWGLPGGRTKEKESLKDAASAKMTEDIGRSFPLSGIFKIEELLIEGRTVFMYIVVAKSSEEFTPTGKAYAYKWADWSEIDKMQIEEFTEYYSKKLFDNYFNKPTNLVPMDIFDTHTYYLFSGESEYMRWWGREK